MNYIYELTKGTYKIETEPINDKCVKLIGKASTKEGAEKFLQYYSISQAYWKEKENDFYPTYHREFMGDFWYNKKNYELEVLIPVPYKTAKEAVKCPCSLRFEKVGDHIALVVWSDWKQGLDENDKWYEHVDGIPIDIIYWEDWSKYKMAVIRPEIKDGFGKYFYEDYIPCVQTWDELFDVNSLSNDWCLTVEDLAYGIINYVDVDKE